MPFNAYTYPEISIPIIYITGEKVFLVNSSYALHCISFLLE